VKDPIKVYDARWEISEFDDRAIRRLFEATLAYARLLNVDTITFTRDARLGSAQVMEIGIQTAIDLGFRVFVCYDIISTPLSYYVTLLTTINYPGTMGLAITASHNPKEYVGVKFTVPVVQAIGLDCGPLDGLQKIRQLYHQKKKYEKVEGGELNVIENPVADYINYSFAQAGIKPGNLKGISVVLDTMNGSAGPELMQALSKAGVKVHPLRLTPNGEFPTGSPNPTSQNKMDNALTLTRKVNVDVLIGVDGDGDRIVFGDKEGIISAGFITIPVLKTLLTGKRREVGFKVLYDPKVNPVALVEWEKMHIEPVLFRNGHSQIKDYMKQVNVLLAAEESGHYYHQLEKNNLEVACENSLLTILLFLRALKTQPNLMKNLREKQNSVFTTGEFNYQFKSDTIRDEAMAAVINFFQKDGAKIQTKTTDGIDLGGTVVNKGVSLSIGKPKLANQWYSGYFRIATNEKGVVRSYLSTGDVKLGKLLEQKTRNILGTEFQGKVVD
jgi:phosphomannomutase